MDEKALSEKYYVFEYTETCCFPALFFFLVRKKIFPALGGYFFSFCGHLAWRGVSA